MRHLTTSRAGTLIAKRVGVTCCESHGGSSQWDGSENAPLPVLSTLAAFLFT